MIALFRREFDPADLYIHTKTIFGIPGADVNFIKGALIISAYSAGASLVALFDRVGGDLHQGRGHGRGPRGEGGAQDPRRRPRNPATIADNVGDNVGTWGAWGPTSWSPSSAP